MLSTDVCQNNTMYNDPEHTSVPLLKSTSFKSVPSVQMSQKR